MYEIEFTQSRFIIRVGDSGADITCKVNDIRPPDFTLALGMTILTLAVWDEDFAATSLADMVGDIGCRETENQFSWLKYLKPSCQALVKPFVFRSAQQFFKASHRLITSRAEGPGLELQ